MSDIECALKRLKHSKRLMESCTVGRNNAKSLCGECGKRSRVSGVAVKLIKLQCMDMKNIYRTPLTVARKQPIRLEKIKN